MGQDLSDKKEETIRRTVALMREWSQPMVESFLEFLMWQLEAIWRLEGIPDDISERVEEAQQLGARIAAEKDKRDTPADT